MLYLFFTGGSGNRGCEAIVRGTKEILQSQEMIVYSAKIQEDKESKLTDVVTCCSLSNKGNILKDKIKHVICWLSYHFGKGKMQVKMIYSEFLKNIKSMDSYLVIGGDVYCYDKPYIYYRVNEILKNTRKVLWGCSIEPESIDEEMKKDLLSYDFIYARESITYDSLRTHGITHNVKLYPDPAFMMKSKMLPFPEGFDDGNIIGINMSPLIVGCEKQNGMTLKNYIRLIDYIISNTECKIALIPHVIWDTSDDRTCLDKLYQVFKNTGRITVLDSVPAEQIKGYIARCRFMIAARTHASIAAYSSCVPTLVVGYSVKARGIAKDIFGDFRNYTISVQDFEKDDDLLNAFLWMWEREDYIKKYLKKRIPEYIEPMREIPELIQDLLK